LAKIALRLASEVRTSIVNYRSSKRSLTKTSPRLRQRAGSAMAIHADVAKRIDVLTMFAAVERESAASIS